jgi:hypothetical protein
VSVAIKDVAGGVFTTNSRIVGTKLIGELGGCLDMETAPSLKDYLNALLPEVDAGTLRTFEFDTEQLYLMSSSSISCWATWIKELKSRGPACRVIFRVNPKFAWQRRALEPIRRLAEETVSVE